MMRRLALAIVLAVWGTAAHGDDAVSLAGELLVASPDLPDPNFDHTVVVLIEHDATGAMGLVINRTEGHVRLGDLLASLEVEIDALVDDADIPVHVGGPVGLDYGFMLHDEGYADASTATVGDGIAMSVGVDVLRAIAEGDGPERYLFALGFAGWGPGQLEAELGAGVWSLAPATAAIVFGAPGTDGADDDTWRRALASRYLDL